MSKVVDRLAELTGFRDRDMLDTTLAVALRDLLRPQRVAIHRPVGDEVDQRWLTRADIGVGDATATSDPLWTDFDALPRMSDHPQRLQALSSQEWVTVAGRGHKSVFPLVSDREAVGVVEIDSAKALTATERHLVTSILRIYRNFQSLLDYSERDTLTGLLNRKTFDEAFYKLHANGPHAMQVMPKPSGRRRKEQQPLPLKHYIGVIDIDHFKAVNDTYGHMIGDEVLLLLSRLMRATFRHHDRLFRFGGEEFVVLMTCATATDAFAGLERFRMAVQNYAFPQVGQKTVSVGFTEVRPDDNAGRAFDRADQAVYWVKTNGRNQVRYHADLVVRGEVNDDSIVGDVELF